MTWRGYALGVLVAGVFAVVVTQTPGLRWARGTAWDVWVMPRSLTGLDESDLPGEQLARLRAENIRLQAELGDYQLVREQLGRSAFTAFTAIPAAVAGQSVDVFGTQLALNRGSDQGVTVGAPVVVYDSVLVGFITTVHRGSSLLTLLFNAGTSLTAEVATPQRPQGLVVGSQHTTLSLTTVPRDVTLEPGQAVVTTDDQPGVPAGLMVGIIESVQQAEHDPYQQARVRIAYDPAALRAVHILEPR